MIYSRLGSETEKPKVMESSGEEEEEELTEEEKGDAAVDCGFMSSLLVLFSVTYLFETELTRDSFKHNLLIQLDSK